MLFTLLLFAGAGIPLTVPSSGTGPVSPLVVGHATPLSPPPAEKRTLVSPRPSITPGIPTISANTTGTALVTYDLAAAGNTGLRTESPIPALPSGLSTNDTLVWAVGEAISANATAFVGFAEGTAFGLTAALPFAYVNVSGTGEIGTGPYALTPGTVVHTFAFQQVHGYWWTFTMDGSPISGGPGSQGNGTFDLGADNASAFAAALPPAPAAFFAVTGNHSSAPSFTIPLVFSFAGPRGWTNASSGEELLAQGLNVSGYLQDPTVPPDTVVINATSPPPVPLTALWNTGPLPALSLSVGGVPSSLIAGTQAQLFAWVNASNGTGVPASVTLTDSLGGSSTVSPGSGPGSYRVTFQAPGVSGTQNDTLVIRAVASGYVGATGSYTVEITPSFLSLEGPPAPIPVASGATRLLDFTLTNSQGTPVNATSETAELFPDLGSASIVSGTGLPTGALYVLYRAPPSTTPVSIVVELTTRVTGFQSVSANATLLLQPRPLLLQIQPPAGPLAPGQRTNLTFSLSGPGLGPELPTNGTWSFPSQPPGAPSWGVPYETTDGSFEIPVVVPSTFVGNASTTASLTIPGYSVASQTVNLSVLGNLTLTATLPSGSVDSGAGMSWAVQLAGVGPSTPVNASIHLEASAGGWRPGGRDVSVPLGPSGVLNVSYGAPSVAFTTTVTLTLWAHATGYRPVEKSWTLSVQATAGSFLGQTWPYLLFAAVLVAVGVVLLARRRGRPASPTTPRNPEPAAAPVAPATPATAPAEYDESVEEPPGPQED